jgi:hypothetical protein
MRMGARTTPKWAVMCAGALAVLATSAALAVPSSLNVMPTADVVGKGKCLVEIEADGHATPLAEGAQVWLLTDFGIGDRLEAGVNRVEGPGLSRWTMDAKLQLVPESGRVPALAIGATDITRRDDGSLWYAVATKGLGPVRATVGYQRDFASRLMLGGAYSLTGKLTLLSDWSSGPLGAGTLGLCRDLGHNRYLLLYYSRNNSGDGGNFAGLNLLWNGELRHRAD